MNTKWGPYSHGVRVRRLNRLASNLEDFLNLFNAQIQHEHPL
jgi:hypothetical protein